MKKFKREHVEHIDEGAADAYILASGRGRKERERLANLVIEVVDCGSVSIGMAVIESYVQERVALLGSKAAKKAAR